MSLSRFFLVGLRGPELAAEERKWFARNPPGGILLFSRNIVSEDQARSLVAEIRGALPEAWILADQEGGPVDRFRRVAGETVSFARAAAIGRAREAGRLAGEILAHFGLDMDLAPVADRAVEGKGSRILRERCVSEDPAAVARAAGEFLEGLAESGIGSCLKHFPGLGRAALDTHRSLPRIEREEGALERDLQPFRRLRDRSSAVMVSHAAIAPSALPATMDAGIATALLRENAGWTKAAVSDDLEMGALAECGSLPERSVRAFAAGCDLLILGSESQALEEAAERLEREASPERIAAAEGRRLALEAEIRRLRGDRKRRGSARPLADIALGMEELRGRAAV